MDVNPGTPDGTAPPPAKRSMIRNLAIAIGVVFVGLVAFGINARSDEDLEAEAMKGPTAVDRREWAAKFQESQHRQRKNQWTFQAAGSFDNALEIGAFTCTQALLEEFMPQLKETIASYGFRSIICPGGLQVVYVY